MSGSLHNPLKLIKPHIYKSFALKIKNNKKSYCAVIAWRPVFINPQLSASVESGTHPQHKHDHAQRARE